MIYATRQTDDSVELYASEANKPAPNGFIACTLDGFRAAWALRDTLRIARLKAAVPASAPRNYQGSRG